MSTLAQIRERLRQHRAAVRQTLTDEHARVSAASRQQAGGLLVGDRVFDLVTGEEVEIVGIRRENIIVPAPERR